MVLDGVFDGVLAGVLVMVLVLVPVVFVVPEVFLVVTKFSLAKSNFSETKIEEKLDIIISQKHTYNSSFDWM